MGPALALSAEGSNPVGRPPSGNPRAVRIVVYLRPDQLEDLDRFVKREESARSWVCVDALVHAGVIRK